MQYRAGATLDLEHDLAASINPLSGSPPAPLFRCPLLVLSSGNLRSRFAVDDIWGALAKDAESVRSVEVLDSGHYVVNEQPEKIAEEVRAWLKKWFEGKV